MSKNLFEAFTFESLIRFIEGRADKKSASVINEWLDADAANRRFFSQISEIWLNRSELSELMGGTMEADLEKVVREIKTHQEEKTKRLQLATLGPLFRKIAAVALVIISIGAAYFAGRTNTSHLRAAEVSYNELIVPQGQRSKVILSDGTSIWLNAGSKLRFPSDFRGDTRDVWLDGEGLFNVAKDTSRLFYVHTSDLDVKVHGTIFNLKAYSFEDIIETTVVEGLVSFEARKNSTLLRKDVYLEPNHKAVFVKSANARVTEEVKREINKPLEPNKIIVSDPISVEPVISWAEGRLIFTDETLENIAEKLERKYDVKIQIDTDRLKSQRYTGILKNVSIEQALKALQLTTGFQYTIDENYIRISEKNSRI